MTNILEAKFDVLNLWYAKAEEKLSKLTPLEDCWVLVHPNARESCFDEFIGLMYYDGHWKLMYGLGKQDKDGHATFDEYGIHTDIRPILTVDIVKRVRAAAHVQALHDKIVKQNEEDVKVTPDEVAAAVGELRKWLDDF